MLLNMNINTAQLTNKLISAGHMVLLDFCMKYNTGIYDVLHTECVISEQRLGEWSAKFAMPGCHTGRPVQWFVAGTGKAAISHFHSPNHSSPITLSAYTMRAKLSTKLGPRVLCWSGGIKSSGQGLVVQPNWRVLLEPQPVATCAPLVLAFDQPHPRDGRVTLLAAATHHSVLQKHGSIRHSKFVDIS